MILELQEVVEEQLLFMLEAIELNWDV